MVLANDSKSKKVRTVNKNAKVYLITRINFSNEIEII